MATTIKLSSPKQLGPAVRLLTRQMDRGVIKALQLTARYGATQALRVSAATDPRPRATGTFERSFVVTKLSDGAVLSNAARHARFVEVGRAAGRQPPVQAILGWMLAKRMTFASEAEQLATARKIARAIGRRGIKGRYILKRTVPIMRKRMEVEIARQVQRVFDKASR